MWNSSFRDFRVHAGLHFLERPFGSAVRPIGHAVGLRFVHGRLVFIGYGIMPLVAVSLVLFALGPLRPLPEFQNREK